MHYHSTSSYFKQSLNVGRVGKACKVSNWTRISSANVAAGKCEDIVLTPIWISYIFYKIIRLNYHDLEVIECTCTLSKDIVKTLLFLFSIHVYLGQLYIIGNVTYNISA